MRPEATEIRLKVNGEPRELAVSPSYTLLEVTPRPAIDILRFTNFHGRGSGRPPQQR